MGSSFLFPSPRRRGEGKRAQRSAGEGKWDTGRVACWTAPLPALSPEGEREKVQAAFTVA
ncbi:hypothetical protein HMP06_1943 [Sphingomonas sp. HMP6]|nr:hypothetical protein HMP06_1943 [Sphingomonas sp. HMP6]